MGFYSEDARNIARHIVVELARGSGHAWPYRAVSVGGTLSAIQDAAGVCAGVYADLSVRPFDTETLDDSGGRHASVD